jgi:hypothetical protein
MRRYGTPLSAFLLTAALVSPSIVAEQGILVVNVRNAADVPVPGVQIGTVGDGATAMTANTGRARIRLANQTRPGSMVTLQLAPYGGRTAVPSFDNESDNYVAVLVIKRGDRQALENAAVLAAAVDRSVPPPPPRDNKGRRRGGTNAGVRLRMAAALARWQDVQPPGNLRVVGPASGLVSEEVARELGFSVADVNEALRKFPACGRR